MDLKFTKWRFLRFITFFPYNPNNVYMEKNGITNFINIGYYIFLGS